MYCDMCLFIAQSTLCLWEPAHNRPNKRKDLLLANKSKKAANIYQIKYLQAGFSSTGML
jgi:hypothetical protein